MRSDPGELTFALTVNTGNDFGRFMRLAIPRVHESPALQFLG